MAFSQVLAPFVREVQKVLSSAVLQKGLTAVEVAEEMKRVVAIRAIEKAIVVLGEAIVFQGGTLIIISLAYSSFEAFECQLRT